MALSHGASLGSGTKLDLKDHNQANLARQMQQRARSRAQDPKAPEDYRLPKSGAADDYLTAPGGVPKTGAADDFMESFFKKLVSGGEMDLDY